MSSPEEAGARCPVGVSLNGPLTARGAATLDSAATREQDPTRSALRSRRRGCLNVPVRRHRERLNAGRGQLLSCLAATVPGQLAAGGAATLVVLVLASCGTVVAPTPSPAPTATTPHPIPTISPYVAPVPVVPHDRGKQLHANGATHKIRGGFRYTVAKDDTAIGIGYRFGVCTADVFHANDDNLDIDVGVRLNIRRVTDEPVDGPDCNL